MAPGKRAGLGVLRGASFYVGALVGPGVLLVPSLAARAAGPSSVIAWAALVLLSVPLAATFAVLAVRHPVAGGVLAYVQEGFGQEASAATGACFAAAVVSGAPAVSLIGGNYVADLTGSGAGVAMAVAVAMYAGVLMTNSLGLRISSAFQIALSSVLVLVIAIATAAALPSHVTRNWSPFAPHGWWAVGTATNILIWLFVGWEAMAQLAGDFRNPARDVPRAVGLAFAVMAVLYCGLALATITVGRVAGSKVPLADLVGVSFGQVGRDASAVLAVALTMGTMNVYVGSAAKLVPVLAQRRGLPRWFSGGADRDIPRRPLVGFAISGAVVLGALAAGLVTTTDLVRATSACFIIVYVLALAAATKVLPERSRVLAALSLVPVMIVAIFSSFFLLVPAVASGLSAGSRRLCREPKATPELST